MLYTLSLSWCLPLFYFKLLFTSIFACNHILILSGADKSPNKKSHCVSKKPKASHTSRSEVEILSSSNLKAFSFSELKSATRNFRPENLLGEGGFGFVYKGWINADTWGAAKPGSAMVVAVKKLKRAGLQGHKEWLVGFIHQLPVFFSSSNVWLCSLTTIGCRLKLISLASFSIQTSSSYLGTA